MPQLIFLHIEQCECLAPAEAAVGHGQRGSIMCRPYWDQVPVPSVELSTWGTEKRWVAQPGQAAQRQRLRCGQFPRTLEFPLTAAGSNDTAGEGRATRGPAD